MHTVATPPGPGALPPPHVTPYFRRMVEQAAAARGLPPDPWPLP